MAVRSTPASRSTTATWASRSAWERTTCTNTPRQMMLLRALGEEPPVLPTCRCSTPRRQGSSSKRYGAVSVLGEPEGGGPSPRRSGNYLAFLGWGLDETTTFLTTEELIENFARAGLAQPGSVRRAEAPLDERPLPAGAGPRRPQGARRGVRRPRGARGRRRDLPGKDADAADFWPLSASSAERQETDQKAEADATARLNGSGGARGAGRPRPVWTPSGSSGPARGRGAARRSASRRVPKARARRDQRYHGLTGIFESLAALGRRSRWRASTRHWTRLIRRGDNPGSPLPCR